jgi:hypothetical protein
MGHQRRQLLATPYVALSLALSCGSYLSNWFHLQTVNFSRPPAIEGPVGDTTIASLIVVAGVMCEE